ncbi:Alcohol dehydrogenase GroES-like domain-containing protein [Cladophialophora immunda]|nr:Alcohol dehydrogenase GroES-like domain-containing protein [Cladophialophora immunda]
MRAAIYRGAKDITVEDRPSPSLEAGRVLVDVEWCGICGSDLHLWEKGPELFGALTKPDTPGPMAISLGHEFCGRVRAANPGSRFRPGDKVMIDPRRPCRRCIDCNAGHPYCCKAQGGYGYNTHGGFAEQVSVSERNVHLLPASVSLEFAALIEPFAVAVHAVRAAEIRDADWARSHTLVLGGGPLGYCMVSTLKAVGVRTVVVSEPAQVRRNQVSRLADWTLDPRTQDVVAKCSEVTNGVGVDIVFDCAGSNAAVPTGMQALKTMGTYLNLAMFDEPMSIPVFLMLSKQITIRNCMIYSDEDFQRTIDLFAQDKLVGIEEMVTARISVDQVVEKGFGELIRNRDRHIKILISPKKPDGDA